MSSHLVTGFAAWFNLMIVATSFGGPPQQEVADRVVPAGSRVTMSLDDQKEIAGLARGSNPELVTWEKVYALAVIRARHKEVLTKATRLVLEKCGDPARGAADEDARAGLELQMRRRMRSLAEMRRAYVDARCRYLLSIRIKDQAIERLIAPSAAGSPERSLLVERFVEHVADVTTLEDQLAELWTTFRADRLARLSRDRRVASR